MINLHKEEYIFDFEIPCNEEESKYILWLKPTEEQVAIWQEHDEYANEECISTFAMATIRNLLGTNEGLFESSENRYTLPKNMKLGEIAKRLVACNDIKFIFDQSINDEWNKEFKDKYKEYLEEFK
jgi:hypothetical protein